MESVRLAGAERPPVERTINEYLIFNTEFNHKSDEPNEQSLIKRNPFLPATTHLSTDTIIYSNISFVRIWNSWPPFSSVWCIRISAKCIRKEKKKVKELSSVYMMRGGPMQNNTRKENNKPKLSNTKENENKNKSGIR